MKNRRKKIALVADSVYPFAKGGKEKRIFDVTTRLAAQGFEVTIYSMKLWDGPNRIVRDGVSFCAIAPSMPLYDGTRRTIGQAVRFAVCALLMLGKDFDVADVDHIPHPVLFSMRIVCWLKRKPMIATWHEVWGKEYWSEYLGGLGWVASLVERVSIMLPDAIISVSKHTTSLLEPLRGKKGKVYTIPNGLDFAHIASIKPEGGADIVYAGRLLSHKNIDVLVRAANLLAQERPDIRVAIIGEGPEKNRLITLARELGLKRTITFKDFFSSHDELYAYLHASRVFVLPSSREGFGIVVVEANACGLPVVTVDEPHNAAKDLIDEGHNGTVVALTPDALAQALTQMLDASPTRDAVAAYARAYDWEPLMQKIIAIYEGQDPGQSQAPHIVVASSYFYPKIGGLENYAFNLAKRLHQSGNFRVSVVTSNYDSPGYKKELIDGMIIHRLPIWFRVSNTPINPLWYWQVRAIFKNDPPAVVHAHSPVPYLPDLAAGAAQNAKVVLTYHSGSMKKGLFAPDLLIGAYERVFLSWLWKRADAVVAVSQAFAKKTFPQYQKKTFFIPTGVDLSKFSPTPLPAHDRLTYVGRIEHSSSWKGIGVLLEAMVEIVRERPGALLELVGAGDALEFYKKRATELGLGGNVVFAGALRGSELIDAYARATAIVLASTSDSEAFSVALVEGMASGRPLIGTAIGGTPQVIEDGKNGLLVPPQDPHALAQAALCIFSDRHFAQALAGQGAQKAKEFSWDIQAKKYADLFDRVLKRPII